MKATTRVEIDVRRCSLTYGSSPCTAALGVTGQTKCFNTDGTCQDIDNFAPVVQTLRYSQQPALDHIPSVAGYDYLPAVINPGVDMGVRSKISVTFTDHPHHDLDLDPYIEDRGGIRWTARDNPYAQEGLGHTLSALHRGVNAWFGSGIGRLFWSPHGDNWTEITPPELGGIEMTGLANGIDGELVVTGFTGSVYSQWRATLTPSGPADWEQLDATVSNDGAILRLVYSQAYGGYVAVGFDQPNSNEAIAFVSDDLETWAKHSLNISTTLPTFLEEVNGLLITGGTFNGLATSSDGETWTARTSGFSFGTTIRGAAYGNGVYVIVANGGNLATSTDAATWTPRTSSFGSTNIRGVAFDGGKFLAVGEDGKAATSVNGVDWTQIQAPTPDDMAFVRYGSGRFLVAAVGGRIYTMAEIEYDPSKRGSYWPKFGARFPYIIGRPMRLITGIDGAETTHHGVIEAMSLSGASCTITAKDPLKLAQGDRAQCPRVSTGSLLGDISDIDGTATLTPTGIGDIEYPETGWAAIGDEIVLFTRVGDALTLNQRGALGTTAGEHAEGDLVQLVKRFNSMRASAIIAELLEDFADVPDEYIPLTDWTAEDDAMINRFYSAHIAKPTSVETLINELIEQCGIMLWFDDSARVIRFRVLTSASVTGRLVDESIIMDGTASWDKQPDKRISQVWTSYRQLNPLEDDEDEKNYAAALASVDLVKESLYGSARIRKVFSRWIGLGGIDAAQRVNDLLLSRYVDAPRRLRLALYRSSAPIAPGESITVRMREIPDAEGEPDNIPAIVTSVRVTPDSYAVTAEEFTYTPRATEEAEFGRIVSVESNTLTDPDLGTGGINARTRHDAKYPVAPDSSTVVTVIVYEGNSVGSTTPTRRALDIGQWPAGCTVNVVIRAGAGVRGAGGNAGVNGLPAPATVNGGNGQDGGVALYTRFPIHVWNHGTIAGGGGGGGGGGADIPAVLGAPPILGGVAGSGAGYVPGSAGNPATMTTPGDGEPGTTFTQTTPSFTQVIGGSGGDGGGLGEPGAAGSNSSVNPSGLGGIRGLGGAGGAAGAAVDGESFITWEEEGTIIGPRVN